MGKRDVVKGDVFRFQYSQPSEGMYDSHTHCFEGILIACESSAGIVLRDTYWYMDGRDGREFSIAEAESRGVMEYIGNMADLEQIPEWRVNYYADADVVRLSSQHACHPNCIKYYRKKGVAVSQTKMIEVCENKLQEAKRNADSAIRDVQRLSEIKGRIFSGDLNVYF